MKTYAVIENGKVVNVVASDDEYAAKQGWILIPETSTAGMGWDYDGSNFTDNRPQPETIELPVSVSPTKEELLAHLQVIQAQIQALAG